MPIEQLDIKINNYPIIIGKELDIILLEKCNYLKPSHFELQLIEHPKEQIVWWAKNPTFKYLDSIEHIIYPNLGDIDKNPDVLYGTSVYLWFKKNKLFKSTFQIIQNKTMATHLLNRLNEEVVKTIGNPTSKSKNFVIWETKTEKFMIEYPKRMHGYVHMIKTLPA